MKQCFSLQPTQPMSDGAVTTVIADCYANCVESPCPQQWWFDLSVLAGNSYKSGKQVWICDICHKQIHNRKQISIRCNRIEHWVHLRCASIRLAQYTDIWTCHIHKGSRLTTHRYNTTPPFQSLVKAPYPIPPYTNTHIS